MNPEKEVDAAVATGIIPPPPPDIQAIRHPDEAAAMDEAERSVRGLPPWIWIGGVIVMVGVILAIAIMR
jgi:hypothetical protein